MELKNTVRNIGLTLILATASLCINAQQPQGPIGSDSPAATAPAPTTSVAPPAVAPEKNSQANQGRDLETEVIGLNSQFSLLKILGLVSILLAAIIGLSWYAYRHARLLSFDTSGGALLALVLGPIFLTLATQILSTDSSACLGLSISGDSSAFADACRNAREGAANMIGLKSAWTAVFGQAVAQGMAVAYTSTLVKSLMYASVTVGAPLLFLVLKPLVKKSLNQR